MKITGKTTAIGSLPHHNIDAALAASFQVDVPFLPQIPIRNPWEFMIAQALEGLPGLVVEKDGTVTLDVDVWTGRSHAFNEKLLNAFSSMAAKRDAFEAFEPSAATSSSWQPFLWELEERGVKAAKIQIAGPLTSQWALRLSDGSNISRYPELASQIFRLVLARALAMSRRLQAGGIQPLLYLDEPALYTSTHPIAMQELGLVIQALRKEGVLVGLHCCSNTDWNAVLHLGLDYVSLDTNLSLEKLLETGAALERYIAQGGRLSLGVIPTSKSLTRLPEVEDLFAELLDHFGRRWNDKPELVRQTLADALYTPACGLALHNAADAEVIISTLAEFGKYVDRSLKKQQ